MPKLNIAVVVGSNRRESVNRKLAQALARLGGGKANFTLVQIDDLPLYNQDLEAEFPASASRMKAELEAADGLLFVTPEHSRSIPAVLKNAIDWAARPWGKNSWAGKPAAITGTSPGAIGTAAAQQHLRHILSVLGAVLAGGEAYVTFKEGLIDAEGTVTDESTRAFLQAFVDNFLALADRFADSPAQRAQPHSPEKRMSIRPVKRIVESKPTLEGAGVHLRRAFGFGETSEFDPFLLLDDFRNDRPQDYAKGFPWHPHRGIETITYVLAGTVDHRDSLGNQGNLGAGDVQWMTAGSGILHQEMPQGDPAGRMHGFQLWANLPSNLKMSAPRYQDIKAPEIPEIVDDDGTRVRVVTGDFWGRTGPVQGVAADPRYLDVFVPPGKRKTLPFEMERHGFAYVFEGSGTFRSASQPFGVLTEKEVDGEEIVVRESTGNRSLVLFDSGYEVTVQAGEQGIRFLLVSGKPLKEPVAWHGPIVMNTQAELRQAVSELQAGTFIKRR